MSRIHDIPSPAIHALGRSHGIAWAGRPGTEDQVANLELCWNELDSSAEWSVLESDDSAYSPAERVALMISTLDHDELDRQVARDFWDTYCPGLPRDTIDNADFLRGFIEGALA